MSLNKQETLYAVEINSGYTNESDVTNLALSAGDICFITGRSESTSAFVYEDTSGITSIYNDFTTSAIDPFFDEQAKIQISTNGAYTFLAPKIAYGTARPIYHNTMTGNFKYEFGTIVADSTASNDIYFVLYDNAANIIGAIWWIKALSSVMFHDQVNQLIVNSLDFVYSDGSALDFKIERTDGLIKFYYKNDTIWNEVAFTSTNTNDVYDVEITSDQDKSGYTYFDFVAETGLITNYTKVGDKFREGFLIRNSMSNASRQIDISKFGNYGDLSDFSFKVNNSNKYWNLLTSAGNVNLTSDINLINKPVKVYVVIDNIFYRIWTGVMTDPSRNEKEFIFNCGDASVSLHKPIPKEIVNDKTVPITFGNNEYLQLVNIASGTSNVETNLLADYDILTYSPVGDYKRGRAEVGIIIFTSASLSADDLKNKYIKVLRGGLSENILDSDVLLKILGNDDSYVPIESWEDKTKFKTKVYVSNYFHSEEMPYIYWDGIKYDFNDVNTEIYTDPRNTSIATENTGFIKIIDPYVNFKYNTSGTTITDDKIYKYNDELKVFESIPSDIINNNDGTVKIIFPNISTEQNLAEFYSPLDFTINSIKVKKNPREYRDSETISGNPCDWSNYLVETSGLSALTDRNQTTYHEIIVEDDQVGVGPFGNDVFVEIDFTINSDVSQIGDIYALPDISQLLYNDTDNTVSAQDSSIAFAYYPYGISDNVIDYIQPETLLGFGYKTWSSTYNREVFVDELNMSGYDTSADFVIPTFHLPTELYDTTINNNDIKFIPEAENNINKFVFNIQDLTNDYYVFSGSNSILKEKSMINETSLSFMSLGITKRFKMMIRFKNNNSETIKKLVLRFHQFSVFYKNTATLDNNIWIKANGISTSAYDTNSVYGTFKYILEESDGIPTSAIDYGNLEGQRGSLTPWETGRQLTDRQSSKVYLNELCEQSYTALFPDRFGKRKFNCYLTSASPIASFDETNIVRDTFKSFKLSPVKDVFNEFILDYDYNPATGDATKHVNITKTDLTVFPSISGDWQSYSVGIDNYFEAKRLWENAHKGYLITSTVVENTNNSKELKWYHNINGSVSLYIDDLINWTSVQHFFVEFSLPLTSSNLMLELTDKIEISDTLLTNNVKYVGYINKLEFDTSKDMINVGIIADQGIFNPTEKLIIIESGDRQTVIDESGDRDIVYQEGYNN